MTNKEFLLEAMKRAIAMSGGIEAFDEMPKPNMGAGMGKGGNGGTAGGGAMGGGDGDGSEATLEEHDKRWHPDGYKGGPCGWREKHGIPTTDPNGGQNPEAQKAAKEAVKGTNINPDNVSEVWTPGQKPQVIQQPEGELKKTQGGLGDLKSPKSAANVEKLEQLNAQAQTPQQKTLIQEIYARLKYKLGNLGVAGGTGAEGGAEAGGQPEARYEKEEDIPYLDDISDEDYAKLSPTQKKQISDKEDKRTDEELDKEFAEKEKKEQKASEKRVKALDKKIAEGRKKLVAKQVGILRENERKAFRKSYDDEFNAIEKRVKSGEITRRQGDRLQKKAEDKYFKAHEGWSGKKDEDYTAEANKRVGELLAKSYQPKPPAEGAKPASQARQQFQQTLGNAHKNATDRAAEANKPKEPPKNMSNEEKEFFDAYGMSEADFAKLPLEKKREMINKVLDSIGKPKPEEAAKVKPYAPSWEGKPMAKPPTPLRKKLGDALQRWGKALSDMGNGQVQHTYRDLAMKRKTYRKWNLPEGWKPGDAIMDVQSKASEAKYGAEANRRMGMSAQTGGQGGAANKSDGLTLHKNSLFGSMKNLDNPDVMGMALDIEKEYNEAKRNGDRKKIMSLIKEWNAMKEQFGGNGEDDEQKRWNAMADKGVKTRTHYDSPDFS